MKKFFYLMIFALATTIFSACGGDDDNNDDVYDITGGVHKTTITLSGDVANFYIAYNITATNTAIQMVEVQDDKGHKEKGSIIEGWEPEWSSVTAYTASNAEFLNFGLTIFNTNQTNGSLTIHAVGSVNGKKTQDKTTTIKMTEGVGSKTILFSTTTGFSDPVETPSVQ